MTTHQVFVSHPSIANGREIEIDITTMGLDGKPDCQIGHFGYNFYFRTPYGVNRKKYQSVAAMKSAITRLLKRNGFKVYKYGEIKELY